jgi:hypothetical protein
MRRGLAAGGLAATILLVACSGITSDVKPGASMAKLCDAARSLADAVGYARAAAAASEAGDGIAAAGFAKQADTSRQSAMAQTSWAADLEGHVESTVDFSERMAEIDAAQEAVDLAVGVLGSPAATVTIEARPRLLDAAETAVHAISLPSSCTVNTVPMASP